MDEDLMTRSSYGKVIFNSVKWTPEHLVCQFYPKYIYEEVQTSALCYIGLYVVPKNNPEDFVIKQEIFIVLNTLGEDIQLNFERSKLPADEDDSFYIFQFMNEKGEVMGASTPFRLLKNRKPPPSNHGDESDEFLVIRRGSRKDSGDSMCSSSTTTNSFVVLSEQFNSLAAVKGKEVDGEGGIPLMSDSVFSMVNDNMESMQSSCNNSFEKEESTPSTSPVADALEKDEELFKVKNQLLVSNEAIDEKNESISKLENEMRLKDKRIEDLEKKIKDSQTKQNYPIQEFQTLHKSDQLKIHQLEMEIKGLEGEMKKISISSHSELEDIRKSISELQTSVRVERPKSPGAEGTSFDYLNSLVIKKALDSSQSADPCSSSEASNAPESISSSEPKSIPVILDNGKVVLGNECPVCGAEFDDTGSLSAHVNNHFELKKNACPLCETELRTTAELEEHVQSHFESDEYEEVDTWDNSSNKEGRGDGGRGTTSFGSGSSFRPVRSVLNFFGST